MSRVGIIGENSIEYVELILKTWNAGDCCVLIDWRLPFNKIIDMIKMANVHLCYIEKVVFENNRDILNNEVLLGIDIIVWDIDNALPCLLPQRVFDLFHLNYSKNEAVVLFSSGSTGISKGIVLTHYAISKNADSIINYLKPNKNDCLFIVKSLSHSSTLVGELLVALITKTPIVLSKTVIMARTVFNIISQFGVTVFCLNPTLLKMYLDFIDKNQYQIHSLKRIYVSGDVFDKQLQTESFKCFGKYGVSIYNAYGLTELGPRVAAQTRECCSGVSVGKPIRDVRVKILDENNNNLPCKKIGYVYVKTPCILKKYLNQDKVFKHNMWFKTGDLGFFCEQGELHIVGRSDEIIILDSHKIIPSEIERFIVDNSTATECVIRKATYNNFESLVCLYSGKEINHERLKKEMQSFFALHEIPKHFLHCNSIPRNINGKKDELSIKQQINDFFEAGIFYERNKG